MISPSPLKGKWITKKGYLWQKFGENYEKEQLASFDSNDLFEDVAAAIAFYKKYKYYPMTFENDYPNEYSNFKKEYPNPGHNPQVIWESWLLGFSFADVVKK